MRANYPESRVMSKPQMGSIVSKIFKNVTIGLHSGHHIYKGIEINLNEDKNCDLKYIATVAAENGYFLMNDNGTSKYALSSGYCINNNEVLKILEIEKNRNWKFSMCGKEIDPSIIGLSGITCNTVLSVNILFNTIKQTKLCKGKTAEAGQNSTRFRIVQEWSACGDENSNEARISSRNCQRVVSFVDYAGACHACANIRKPVANEKDVETDVQDNDLLDQLFPGANQQMLNIIKQQSHICKSNKDPRSRRWDKDILQVSLTLWNRSPQAYTTLRNSGILFLPSEALLQRYKNCVKQSPGINHEMLQWLYQESTRLNTEKEGGLILDEMAVQEDLQLCFENGKVLIDGFVDLGQISNDMYKLNEPKAEIRTAKYILQFVYLGFDGFRFPVSYFPSAGVNAPELYFNVWELISQLTRYDFSILYVCFDGGSSNRAFQLMNFKDKNDAIEKNFTSINPFKPSSKVTFIMDFSHNMKKLRNNLYSSGDHEFSTRKLKLKNKLIVWNYWIKAYNWDKNHNPMRVHRKLTNDHIFLNRISKMRNHLAEQVLDCDMLHLMTKYQESLKDGSHLQCTIELLEHSSKVIEIFRDPRPVTDLNDQRLQQLAKFETWLKQWYDEIELQSVEPTEKAKMFLTKETYSDIISMLRGFHDICARRITDKGKSVVPASVNSDVIENFFCQQRTIRHGPNCNPSVHEYKFGINSTILGQTAISKKSNAVSEKALIHPKPFHTEEDVKKKKLL